MPGQTIDFDPECPRQQRISGRQQGVGARWQTRHPRADCDLLAGDNAWRFARRMTGLSAGDDGVDRIAGNARQGEAIAAVLHQRVEARVGRAATPGDEAGTGQLAAAAHVNHRALIRHHRLTAQLDPAWYVAERPQQGFAK